MIERYQPVHYTPLIIIIIMAWEKGRAGCVRVIKLRPLPLLLLLCPLPPLPFRLLPLHYLLLLLPLRSLVGSKSSRSSSMMKKTMCLITNTILKATKVMKMKRTTMKRMIQTAPSLVSAPSIPQGRLQPTTKTNGNYLKIEPDLW